MIEDFPVKDQGDNGCCWISSRLAGSERLAKEKFGEYIPLSENHMILSSIFYHVEESLYYGLEIEASVSPPSQGGPSGKKSAALGRRGQPNGS